MTIRISVDGDRATLVGGLLRPQRVVDGPDGPRVGLVATTALLLGGDEVDLVVEVGSDSTLDLFDVAGTVAYSGRGRPAAWRMSVAVGEGGRFRYSGQPFVTSDGADVTRTVSLDIAASAQLWMRETLVLGREGQLGGRVRSRTGLTVGGTEVWREDTDLDPAGIRRLPGMLGSMRVLDTLVTLGRPAPTCAPAVAYALTGGVGTVTRWLGSDLSESPLN